MGDCAPYWLGRSRRLCGRGGWAGRGVKCARHLTILLEVARISFISYGGTSLETFDDHASNRGSHVAFLDWYPGSGYTGKMAPNCVQSGRVDEKGEQECEYVYTADCQDLSESTAVQCLINAIAWADEEKDQKEEDKDGECSAIEDTEDRNTHSICCIIARLVGGVRELVLSLGRS